MKVLILINGLGTGGAEHSLLDLMPELDRRGIDAEVLCLYTRNVGVFNAVAKHVPVSHVRSNSRLGRIREVRGFLKSVRPDLLHTTLFESDLTGRFAAIGTNIPVLSSVVNMSYEDVRLADKEIRPWKLMLAKWADGWTARHLTDHIHVLTEAVGQSVQAHLGVPSSRITVVGRGRNLGRLGERSAARRQASRRALGLLDEDRVVLSVGRHEFQKGQVFLVSAMVEVLSMVPTACLIVAGRQGHASRHLVEAVRLNGLDDRVTLLGHRTDIGDLLSAADLFAFPSLFEGFGGAMLEAMAAGVPIVASDLPPLREVVGPDVALLVPPGSPRDLAQAIAGLLNDPAEAQRRGRLGQSRVNELFDIGFIAEMMTKLYHKVAGLDQPESVH